MAKKTEEPAELEQSEVTETAAPDVAETNGENDSGERDYLVCRLFGPDGEPADHLTTIVENSELKVIGVVFARNPDHALRKWVDSELDAHDPNDIAREVFIFATAGVHGRGWKPKNTRMQIELL